jgi:hypothetical protein
VGVLQDELLDDGFDIVNGQTPNAQSGTLIVPAGGFYKVALIMSTSPANAKIQSSTGVVPDVWYAGWFSWTKDGRPGERIPIHFEAQELLAPPEVDGFFYQYNQAYEGSAIWQRRVKREFVDRC